MLYSSLAAIALLATSVIAQGTSGLPSCATSCISNYGGCNQVDVKCICTNQDLLTQLSCCVSQKCDADEVAQVVQFADTLCGSYGVTTLPQAASCSGSASSAASSTGTAGTATGTSSPASASASATSSGTAASASATMDSSASDSASAAASTSGSSAGKNYKAEGMGIGMAVLGFLAAL